MSEGHPSDGKYLKDICKYEIVVKSALDKQFKHANEVKWLAVRFFRTMQMCHCDDEITKLMHATFRRDRKRHFRPFILLAPEDAYDEKPEFVKLRTDFLNTLLDHFMLTKYHD